MQSNSTQSFVRALGGIQNERQKRLHDLIAINTDDMLDALGLEGSEVFRHWLRPILQPAAHRFAAQMLEFDDAVGSGGLRIGGATCLSFYIRRMRIYNVEHLPAAGPLLILANHPGLYDTIGLFAGIPRPDLRVIAAERPFLQALAHVSQHLFYVPEQAGERLSLLRNVARHLRHGGAALTFPAGKIEPDPAMLSGAQTALTDWSSSLELLARLAPDLTIVPAIVSRVLTPAALRHPLVRLRRSQASRHRLAAMLQVTNPARYPVDMQIEFGRPIRGAGTSEADGVRMREQTLAEASRLIAHAQKNSYYE
jgi:1-acyl-sn-glycerol-3-phosphate acyltransferase